MALVAILAFVLTIIDQISKFMAVKYLKPLGSISFIKNVINLTFIENRVAAFGILNGARVFFVLITIIVTVGIFIYLKKYIPPNKEYRYVKAALILILAGAWGNAIDRIIRGYVVDYFETVFIKWPVFNIADIYVVLGTIILAFLFIFVIKEKT